MISPTEIRAGNWVIKITGTDINKNSFFEYHAIAPDEYYFTFARVCFPVQLSPAVLALCGFKHEFGDWYINRPEEGIDGGVPFLRYRHRDRGWYLGNEKLWSQPLHVHQIQNLYYALSNTELNIQLGNFQNAALMGPIDFFVRTPEKNYRASETM